MLTVTLLIHSVLLRGRQTVTPEADVCEEFSGGSALRGADVTYRRREVGEPQGSHAGEQG